MYHLHTPMQYTNMYIHTQPCTTHTHHHVHAGWILSSVCCEPERSLQGCGEAPSGWGYSRPAEQGGKSCSSVNCSVMYSTLSTPHSIPGKIKFREHIQQISGTDMHGRANSFVHWKHVH